MHKRNNITFKELLEITSDTQRLLVYVGDSRYNYTKKEFLKHNNLLDLKVERIGAFDANILMVMIIKGDD